MNTQQRVMVLLELLGGPKFATEMKAAATSAGMLGKNIEKSGRSTFVANQALYTLRRYAFYGTLALGGMAVAVGKLGFSYLSAMQNARVALGPVIKDQNTLNGYLNQLFQISKYSPFVITDLALAFRQLFAGMHPIGVSAPTIIKTIKSLTDLQSFTGKVGPGSLNRVALALQHMAYAGHLTGYAVNQLSRDGIPIFAILNKQLGISADQFHNIAKMGIPAAKVLAAINKYASTTTGPKNAALRLSMGTFTGLMQVLRDSISQVSGALITGAFKGGQSWLFNLVKPGGPLDRISKYATTKGHSGSDTLMFISKLATGGTGLGKGLLILLQTLGNIGKVFAHVIVPAWLQGAKVLIIFYPILKLVNSVLVTLTHHATAAKIVFAVLAAEFFLTHASLIMAWTGMKLFNIATLGAIGPIKKLILFLGYATIGPSGMIAMNAALKSLILDIKLFTAMSWLAAGPFIAWAVAILAVIVGLRKLDNKLNLNQKTTFRGGKYNPITYLAKPGQFLLGQHAQGGFVSTRAQLVGEHGPEIAHLPMGTRITPARSVSSVLNTVGGSTGDGAPIVVQVILDRKVLAEGVARANKDKQARR